jgi:hypothetical protein
MEDTFEQTFSIDHVIYTIVYVELILLLVLYYPSQLHMYVCAECGPGLRTELIRGNH